MEARKILNKLNTQIEPAHILVVVLVIFAVLSRWLPHPANFTPIAGIAIFGGSLLPKRWALVLPLIAMIISDLIIGLHPLFMYTWGSFVLMAWVSHRYLKNPTTFKVVGASLGASILFYVVTNFAVWAEGLLYPRTWAGLLNSYYMALPFFRNTLLGDLFYSSALFGAFALVKNHFWQKATTIPTIRT